MELTIKDMLKVEIGGDCQTTEGTESSHMHTREDLNYERGKIREMRGKIDLPLFLISLSFSSFSFPILPLSLLLLDSLNVEGMGVVNY